MYPDTSYFSYSTIQLYYVWRILYELYVVFWHCFLIVYDGMDKKFRNIDELIELVKNKETFRFKIKVVANSKNNSMDFCEDFIKIKVVQRAIEGKANRAIIEFLSKTLDVAKSNIEIVNGEKSALKTIKIF